MLGFDIKDIEIEDNLILPEGKYFARIAMAILKENKAGNGKYVFLDFEIIQGPQSGRHFFDRINTHNINESAQDIGRQQLKKLALAVNLESLNDPIVLQNKLVIADIGVQKSTDPRYPEDKNKVKKYLPTKNKDILDNNQIIDDTMPF